MPKKNSKVKIVADSVCDLSPELLEKYDISVIPLYVRLGEKTYKDSEELRPADMYNYVAKTGVLPATAAIPIGDYIDFFKKYREEGREVICIDISSDFSSTIQNARIAAQEVGGVYVLDSRNLSTGEGHVVLRAAILACQGLGAQDILHEMETFVPRVRASFILDNLDYMRKGGRCSSVAVLGANLLHIKPSIIVEDGKMHLGQKFRGTFSRVLEQYVDSLFGKPETICDDLVFITHTGVAPEIIGQVRKNMERHLKFERVIETRAGATVTSHCGPNTLGVLFVEK